MPSEQCTFQGQTNVQSRHVTGAEPHSKSVADRQDPAPVLQLHLCRCRPGRPPPDTGTPKRKREESLSSVLCAFCCLSQDLGLCLFPQLWEGR